MYKSLHTYVDKPSTLKKSKKSRILHDTTVSWKTYWKFYSTTKMILFLSILGLLFMGVATNFRTVYNYHMFQWAIALNVNQVEQTASFNSFILFASLSVSCLMIANFLFYLVCLLASMKLFELLNWSLMYASISGFYSKTPNELIISTIDNDLNMIDNVLPHSQSKLLSFAMKS